MAKQHGTAYTTVQWLLVTQRRKVREHLQMRKSVKKAICTAVYFLLSFVTSPVCTRTMFGSLALDNFPRYCFWGRGGIVDTHKKGSASAPYSKRLQGTTLNSRAYVVHLYVSKLRLDKFCNYQMLSVSIRAWLKKKRGILKRLPQLS